MADQVTLTERCSCGAITELRGDFVFVSDIIAQWRAAHLMCNAVPANAKPAKEPTRG
jgi:hypothetical protein